MSARRGGRTPRTSSRPCPRTAARTLDPAALTLGGAWGSYWYNGFVYQTDITKGLKVFKDKIRWSAQDVDRLNPQTQIWPEKRKKRSGW